jgi:predicted acyl esterase
VLFITFTLACIHFKCTSGSKQLIKGDYTVVKDEFTIVMEDGIVLDALSYIPKDLKKPNGLPAIIYCHGFGLSKDSDDASLKDQAEFGYATFSYSMRGQGKSGGVSDIITRRDAQDLINVVNYVKSLPGINDDRVCIAGGSQGGIVPFMAVAMGMDVRCLITDLATPDFASSWIENNSIKLTLLWTLSYDNTKVRYSDNALKFKEWILSGNAYNYQQLFEEFRTNRDFTEIIGNIKIPMLISNAWQDKFFNTTGVIDNLGKFGVFNKLYFGTMIGHGSEVSQDELRYRRKLTDEWLRVWLDDIDGNTINTNLCTYVSSSFPVNDNNWTWKRNYSDAYPFEEIENLKFYLHPGGRLAFTPNESSIDTLSFINEVSTSLTLKQAVNLEFTGNEFSSKFHRSEIIFFSDPFVEDYTMLGAPVVDLYYSSSASSMCQFNLQFYEVDKYGNNKLITRANYTDIFATPYSHRNITFKGQAHSHIFKKGNRLKVIVTNLDNTNGDIFLRTNPFVLPVLESARNYIFMNTSQTSTSVILPILKR